MRGDVASEAIAEVLHAHAPLLAAEFLPALERGAESWCAALSEPDDGDDPATVRTRGKIDGNLFQVTGRKVAPSAVGSDRCLVLIRTAGPENSTRGLSVFLLDLDAPGVTVVPAAAAGQTDGDDDEIVLDDTPVGADRLVGRIGDGLEVAMSVLERTGGTRS